MKIGIDLDNTINENKNTVKFFSVITHAFQGKGKIYIITNRDKNSLKKTENELKGLGIHYDEIIITADKADVILKEGISIYFDDTDEYFIELPESVTVFKIRELGNFDFQDSKWVYGEKTGKMI